MIVIGIIIGLVITEYIRFLFGFHSFIRKQKKKWIGVDLDGTLAVSISGPFDATQIGEPIQSTIDFILEKIKEGKEIKVVTARVSTDGSIRSIINAVHARYYIKKYIKEHIGVDLDVTSSKDFLMTTLYDDRVVQVQENQGIVKTPV